MRGKSEGDLDEVAELRSALHSLTEQIRAERFLQEKVRA